MVRLPLPPGLLRPDTVLELATWVTQFLWTQTFPKFLNFPLKISAQPVSTGSRHCSGRPRAAGNGGGDGRKVAVTQPIASVSGKRATWLPDPLHMSSGREEQDSCWQRRETDSKTDQLLLLTAQSRVTPWTRGAGGSQGPTGHPTTRHWEQLAGPVWAGRGLRQTL